MEDTILLQAIKEARSHEAARVEAVSRVQDLRCLRLMELHDAIAPLTAGLANTVLFDLHVEPGTTPRLWLGPTSCVVMEPDPRTYRLMEITAEGQGVVFQTADAKAMKSAALKQMARQAVAPVQTAKRSDWRQRSFSALEVILASLLGLALGLVVCGLWALQAGFLRWR